MKVIALRRGTEGELFKPLWVVKFEKEVRRAVILLTKLRKGGKDDHKFPYTIMVVINFAL